MLPTKRTLRRCNWKIVTVWLLFVVLSVSLVLAWRRHVVNSRVYKPAYPREKHLSRNVDTYIAKYDHSYWKQTTYKHILVWTPFYGDWAWYTHAQAILETCPHKCTVTSEKLKASSSDAIVFHAKDLWKCDSTFETFNPFVDMPSSTKRNTGQVWILASWEPVVLMRMHVAPHTYNWTVTYRRDSTIYSPHRHHYKKSAQEMQVDTSSVEDRNYFEEKHWLAVAVINDCYDQARRYRIIRELQKYIKVNVFGKCTQGTKPCHNNRPSCGVERYKFYLAFEDNFCRDYISNQFWDAIDRRQIPVIAAPRYTTEMLPPSSYLNLFDFPDIKTLAMAMDMIAIDENLYNSFFDWLPKYTMFHEPIYCRICSELHANRSAQSYADMDGWIGNDVCHRKSMRSIFSGSMDRFLFDAGLT